MKDEKDISEQSSIDLVREARKRVWSKNDFDINKVFDSMKKREAELRKEGVEFADDLKPSLPPDFYERLQALNEEKNQSKAA